MASFLNKINPIINFLKDLGYTNIIFLVLSIIIVFVLIYLALSIWYKSSSSSNKKEGYNNNNDKQAELILYFADWCPHCKTAKPIWNDFRNDYENKTINGYHIIFTEVDCSQTTDETERQMDKYKVNTFPTLKLIKDGHVIDFDSTISKPNLEEFMTTML